MLWHMWNYLKCQKGQGMVEYALILALVGVVLAASLTSMEGGIAALFDSVKTKLTAAPAAPTT